MGSALSRMPQTSGAIEPIALAAPLLLFVQRSSLVGRMGTSA
jgi:hypothetical protein